MSKTSFFVGLLFLLITFSSFFVQKAQAFSCSSTGYTVIFVNGILGNKDSTLKDISELQKNLGNKFESESLVVKSGYNPSHLEGIGDVGQTIAQMAGHSITDYDLTTILLELYPELTTRKVLLVGHSQGTFYTNAIYDYLLTHGVSSTSVGVYNIATPASVVAGGGQYLNSNTDRLLSLLHGAAVTAHLPPPLPSNIGLPISDEDKKNPYPGHLFRDPYLKQAPERIVGEIDAALGRLTTSDVPDTGDCFTVPKRTFSYKAESVGFAVADPVAHGVHVGGRVVYTAGSATVGAVAKAGSAVAGAVGSGLHAVGSIFSSKKLAPVGQTPDKDFTLTKTLYGSSLSNKDYQELQNSQGGAVVLGLGSRSTTRLQEVPSVVTPPVPLTEPTVSVAVATATSSLGSFTPGGGGVAVPLANAPSSPLVLEDIPEATSTVPDSSEIATSTPTTTLPVVDSTPTTTPTTTPEVVATSTPTTTPTIFTIASQEDESALCAPDWNDCYATGGYFIKRLGLGASLQQGSSTIYNFTITKDETSPYADKPWSVAIFCYTDPDYSQSCPDWVLGTNYNGQQTHFIVENATTTTDGRHWTGEFTDAANERNYDGTEGIRFNPEYYYEFWITDGGWSIGAYGSATLREPYWVLRGRGVVE